MNKVKIKSDGAITRIFIDGKEVHDVTEYKLTQLGGEVPILHIHVKAPDIEVEGNTVTCIENKVSKTTEKVKPLEINLQIDNEIFCRAVSNALNKEEK